MAKLTTKERKKIPAKDFAVPGKRAYPIEDRAHARNALARTAQHASPAEKKEIKAKVAKKFPGIKQGKDGQGKKEHGTMDGKKKKSESKREPEKKARKRRMGDAGVHEGHSAIGSQAGMRGKLRMGKK